MQAKLNYIFYFCLKYAIIMNKLDVYNMKDVEITCVVFDNIGTEFDIRKAELFYKKLHNK